MELSDLDQYWQTRTLTEKLRAIFNDKWSEMEDQDEWNEYLDLLEGVEHIRKFSNFSDPLAHLFDVINKEPFKQMVIEDTWTYSRPSFMSSPPENPVPFRGWDEWR